MRGIYFTSCVVFFRGKMRVEKNVRAYYRPKHRIRGLLFYYLLFRFRPPSAKTGLTGIVQCNMLTYFARSLAAIR